MEAAASKILNVVVVNEDASKRRFFVRPASSTVGEVLADYRGEVGVEDGDFVKDDGSAVDVGVKIGDVNEVAPELVRLVFEKHQDVTLKMIGDESVWSLRCRPSSTPADLRPTVQGLLGPLLKGREFRLRSCGRILDDHQPLVQQNRPWNSELQVDLAFSLEVQEPWANLTVELDSVYATDECGAVAQRILVAVEDEVEELLPPISDDDDNQQSVLEAESLAVSRLHQAEAEEEESKEESVLLPLESSTEAIIRVTQDGRRLPATGALLPVVRPNGAPWVRRVLLWVEFVRTVILIKGFNVILRQVWPSDCISNLANGSVMIEGRSLTNESAQDIDLAEGAVVIRNPLSVTLCLPGGEENGEERTVVSLAQWATVGDLRREAMLWRGKSRVHLRRRNEFLDDDSLSLAEAGIVGGSAVTVDLSPLTLEVHWKDGRVTWSPEQRQLSFMDFAVDLSGRCTSELSDLLDTTFECTGCRRQLWKQEKEQQIPVNCCPTASRRLKVWTPSKPDRRVDEKALEARWRSMEDAINYFRKENDALKAELERGKKRNSELVADKERSRTSVAEHRQLIEVLKKEAEDLDKKLEEVTVLPFFVYQCCPDFNDGNDFTVDLPLSPNPTVGELRAAIARHMQRTPGSTILERFIGRSGGEDVFRVGESWSSSFLADVAGNRKDDSSLTEKTWEYLEDDAERFLVVTGYRNFIHVYQRR